MKTWIVTVRMLRKNPAHNPQAKVSGLCPVSEFCTDVTGEHHSFISAGPQDEGEVREMVARHGAAGGYRLTRIEEVSEERAGIGVRPGECGETDGISLCTEPEGHGRPPGSPGEGLLHWDRHTQHEWSGDEAP